MDKIKANKYKLVFALAKTFLSERISESKEISTRPDLHKTILKKHLEDKAEFKNISDANRRLIESLQNRNRMSKVIDFESREKKFKKILFSFNPKNILSSYKNSATLLDKFRQEFKLQNAYGKGSLWRVFSEGIIDGSNFMASFKNKDAFDEFIDKFATNKYSRAALPMLLGKEIKGFGFALACDFLKELGYREYPKPDVHLKKIFSSLELCPSSKDYEVYKSIIEMSEVVNEDAYTIDKIFWLIGSGRFYLVGIKIGRNGNEFIAMANKVLKNS